MDAVLEARKNGGYYVKLDELIQIHETHYAQLLNSKANTEELAICDETVKALKELGRKRRQTNKQ